MPHTHDPHPARAAAPRVPAPAPPTPAPPLQAETGAPPATVSSRFGHSLTHLRPPVSSGTTSRSPVQRVPVFVDGRWRDSHDASIGNYVTREALEEAIEARRDPHLRNYAAYNLPRVGPLGLPRHAVLAAAHAATASGASAASGTPSAAAAAAAATASPREFKMGSSAASSSSMGGGGATMAADPEFKAGPTLVSSSSMGGGSSAVAAAAAAASGRSDDELKRAVLPTPSSAGLTGGGAGGGGASRADMAAARAAARTAAAAFPGGWDEWSGDPTLLVTIPSVRGAGMARGGGGREQTRGPFERRTGNFTITVVSRDPEACRVEVTHPEEKECVGFATLSITNAPLLPPPDRRTPYGLAHVLGRAGRVAHLGKFFNTSLQRPGPAHIYFGFADALMERVVALAEELEARLIYLESSTSDVRTDPNSNKKTVVDPTEFYARHGFGYNQAALIHNSSIYGPEADRAGHTGLDRTKAVVGKTVTALDGKLTKALATRD